VGGKERKRKMYGMKKWMGSGEMGMLRRARRARRKDKRMERQRWRMTP
jgi:hypothetical protein